MENRTKYWESAMYILYAFCIFAMVPAGCKFTADFKPPADDLVSKGQALENQREYSRAIELFNKALELDKKSIDAQYGIAECYERQNDFNNAIAEYRKIIAIAPEEYEAYLSIWQILVRRARGNPDTEKQAKHLVQEEFEKILSENIAKNKILPESVYYTAVSVYDDECLDMPDKFWEFSMNYLNNYPGSTSRYMDEICHICFANILSVQGKERLERAKEYAQKFPPCQQRNSCFRIVLSFLAGLSDSSTKDITELKRYCELWTTSEPENVMAMIKSSWIYIEFDVDYDRALVWLTKALPILEEKEKQTQPDWYYEDQYRDMVRSYEVLQSLGYCYIKKKDLKNAEQYLLKSLAKNDFCEATNYYLGRCYELSGDAKTAFEYYAKSLICRGSLNKAKEGFLRTGAASFGGEETGESLHNMLALRSGVTGFTDVTFQAKLIASDNPPTRTGAWKTSWADYNNDGSQDLLAGGCLWKNNGDGTFANVINDAKLSGLNDGVWADFNNDGWLDFFSGGDTDSLWRNNGDGTFTNVTAECGNLDDTYRSVGAGWGDYDRDGFVDLYVSNYEMPGPELANGTPDMFWHNINGKFFKNVLEESKMTVPENMCGHGVSWADYNQDGWLDIMVSNYRLDPNFLWKNNGNGSFTNVAKETGVEGKQVNGRYAHTQGSDWADYDNDGDWDLFEANLAHPRYIEFSNMSYLLENQGAPEYVFKERRRESGIRYEETHTNPAFCDYDNDGWQDLFVTSCYEEKPSFLYKNNGDKTFTDITWLAGVRVFHGRGCAWCDYDNDGDMDLAVATGGELYLFRNDCPKDRHWLEVKLRGTHCNRAGIGGQITVIAGDRKYLRQIEGGSGDTSQEGLIAHFGLGDYNGEVRIKIIWPCGAVQEYSTTTNKIVEVVEKN